ncbi:MAG TPA: hypothetical protein VFY96_15175 [Candidatus Binatia bacterium]|jgi:hypothetical protein|nr:hypothetical protein [Candidatus Binatia bacterium]
MKDERDDKLDLWLRQRQVTPATSDLAQRIILRSQQVPQIKAISLWQSIRALCAEFHLPKPAYVLASALTIGLVIGFSTPQDTDSSGNDVVAAQSFLAVDEAML